MAAPTDRVDEIDQSRTPDLPVLVLSMHDESLYADRALRAGASGYLMKREALDSVITAVRTVLDGEIYLSATMAKRMIAEHVGMSGRARSTGREIDRSRAGGPADDRGRERSARRSPRSCT